MASKSAIALAFAAAQGARMTKRRARTNTHRAQTSLSSMAGIEVRNFHEDVEDWITTFAPGTTNAEIAAFCGGDCALVGHPDQGGAAWAAVKGSAKLEQRLNSDQMSTLRSKIEFVEPDRMTYAIPLLESELTTSKSASWGLDTVGVPQRAFHGKGVHIYVMDTGVRTTHADFGGRAYPGMDVSDGTVVECNGDRECAKDTLGHGTHCAGTAGSSTYGVADQASVYAIKTLGAQGGSNSWQFSGVDWVVTTGARPAVISASLGARGIELSWSPVIKSATDAGIVVVVAGGNSVDDACLYSPAFAPEAITVGAIAQDGNRGWYSNFGKCVNIMAPGTDIVSTWVTNDESDRLFTGTSMACPHVSGAAALLLEENSQLTPVQVREELVRRSGYGTVDDLKGSADSLLWVGASPAPTGAPTPAPAPTCDPDTCTSLTPDGDGDCKCKTSYDCSEDGAKGCSYSGRGKSVRFHSVTCQGCECKRNQWR